MQPGDGSATGTGLIASVRRLAATLVDAFQTRLELLSTEAEEHVLRQLRLALMAISALLLLMLGVLVATLFIIIVFWDTHRVAATGVLALVYLLGGIGLGMHARRSLRAQPRLFAATLAELAKDRQQLKGGGA